MDDKKYSHVKKQPKQKRSENDESYVFLRIRFYVVKMASCSWLSAWFHFRKKKVLKKNRIWGQNSNLQKTSLNVFAILCQSSDILKKISKAKLGVSGKLHISNFCDIGHTDFKQKPL